MSIPRRTETNPLRSEYALFHTDADGLITGAPIDQARGLDGQRRLAELLDSSDADVVLCNLDTLTRGQRPDIVGKHLRGQPAGYNTR